MTLVLALLALCASPDAVGAPTLPYATRNRAYDPTTPTIRGDVRNIGMAGANVGLADSFMATVDNPAGLALAVPNGGIVTIFNSVSDAWIQPFSISMPAYHFGAFSPEYPWGWGVSFSQPGVESQTFVLPSGQTAQLAAGVRELKLSAARLFFDHRLSLGVSVNLGEAYRSIEFEKDATTGLRNPSIIQETYAIGATLAAQYQLPQRILLGLTLTSPLFFPGDTSMNTADLPSFYQEVWVPWRLGIGVGWIPNRFFQAGFSAHLIGVTPRASRLQDQAVSVGRELTIQPRLGFSYRAIEYPDLIVEASSGTYLEFPRIEGVTGPRPHLTVGFEVKPWIFGVGFAVDYAPDYSNFLLSFGLDVGRMLQKMKLFPPTWSPPAAGVFPEPFRYRAEGLPRPLNPEWKEKHAAPNVFEVVEQIPERMEDKIEEVKDKGLGGVIDTKLRVGQPPPPKRKRGEKPRH